MDMSATLEARFDYLLVASGTTTRGLVARSSHYELRRERITEEVYDVTGGELFTTYTRLAFGATMIIAALCLLLEQIGSAL